MGSVEEGMASWLAPASAERRARMRCLSATTVVCCGEGTSRWRSGRDVLKRMVTWSGGGVGGRWREDKLRGVRGRFSRGGRVGEEDDDDDELAPPRFFLEFFMVSVVEGPVRSPAQAESIHLLSKGLVK